LIQVVLTYDAVTEIHSYKKRRKKGTTSIYGTHGPFTDVTGSCILYGDNPGGPDGSNGNPNNAPLYGALFCYS
jgi:hypothetical protein